MPHIFKQIRIGLLLGLCIGACFVPSSPSIEATFDPEDYFTERDYEEINCLAIAAMGEAENQGELGQMSVMAFLMYRANELKISICDVTERPYYITSVFLYRKNIDWRIERNFPEWQRIIGIAKRMYVDPHYRDSTPIEKGHNHFLTVELAETYPPRWYKTCVDRTIVGDHVFCTGP